MAKIRSPSKHINLTHLRYLRENNYISKTYVEYCKEEVDELYMEKCTLLGEKTSYHLYKKRLKENRQKRNLPPIIKSEV